MKSNKYFVGYDNIFSTRLRGLMEVNSITQLELAKELGITRQAVAQYMDGTAQPNIDKLLRMSEFFEVSCDYLLGKTKESTVEIALRAVCEYTGLTENAIKTICSAKQLRCEADIFPFKKMNVTEVINELFDNDEILFVFREISYLKDYILSDMNTSRGEARKTIIEELTGIKKYVEDSFGYGFTISLYDDLINASRYRIQADFMDIVKRVTNPRREGVTDGNDTKKE